MHGFVCSKGHPRGAYVAQVYVLYTKCIVLYHPGTKIVDFAMENGPQRGAAVQTYLGYPRILYTNLYYLVSTRGSLETFFGLIKGLSLIHI